MEDVYIKKIDYKKAPMKLLLLTDPSRESINRYLKKGNCLAAYAGNEVIGVCVIMSKNAGDFEIMNIAVSEGKQNKGIGKLLILGAIEMAKKEEAKKLLVGTGNSSLKQLAFYQKCGFKIFETKKDHFIKNYKKPIFENGMQCKDMIMLKLSI